MSYIPFKIPQAADTLSNYVVYRKQVNMAAVAQTTLFTTNPTMGSFVPTEVLFHVDSAVSGLVTATFAIGFGTITNPFDNIVARVTKGSGVAGANDLRVNKRVALLIRAATGTNGTATPANASTAVKIDVTTATASAMLCTFFVGGYYTGMRP